MGEEAGEDEWVDAERAEQLFFHTEEYSGLIRPETLFLFGRRGSGKTTMLNYLARSVAQGRLPRHAGAAIIPSKPIVDGLVRLAREAGADAMTEDELSSIMATIWLLLIRATATVALSSRPDAAPALRGEVATFLEIISFDADSGAGVAEGIVAHMQHHAGRAATADSAGMRLYHLQAAIDTDLSRKRWPLARQTLRSGEQYCLVMIDSSDVYDQRDRIHRSIITGLIDALLTLYNRRGSDRILTLAAFPAEIVSHITPLNWGKAAGKTLWLAWNYKELTGFIAKRLAWATGDTVLDRFEDPAEAAAFLDARLPPCVTTRAGFDVDSAAYVIRHSQRTPRHLIQIMNAMLSSHQHKTRASGKTSEYAIPRLPLLEGNSLPSDTVLTAKELREGVHRAQDLLIREVFDVFRLIYGDRCDEVTKRVLEHLPAYFPAGELDHRLTTHAGFFRRLEWSIDDVRRIILAAGVVGLATQHHGFKGAALRAGGGWFLECLYEYETRHALGMTADDVLCIHPMFYSWLRCRLDRRVLIYPYNADPVEAARIKALCDVELGSRTTG